MNFKNELLTIVTPHKLLINEPMSKHTTFRIGGPADYFVDVDDVAQLQQLQKLCKTHKMNYIVIGNGSNILVGDLGIRGLVIQVYKSMTYIKQEENTLIVGAGTILSKVANHGLQESLTGLEYAAGIPGTIGGAMVMNAGAYGGEMSQVVESVKVLDKEGNIKVLTKEELKLGYRTSIIPKESYIVIEVTVKLEKGNPKEIKEKMLEYRDARISKQPLQYPSAGSTFKRPEGYFAGKLVQDAGMRGYQVGDAQVSEKHSGFVINKGNATAQDVKNLMDEVRKQVAQQFEVNLEPEVKMVGEFK